MLTRIDVDENGDTVPSTTSEVIPIQHKKLDPHAPIFSTSAAKTAFVRTLPSAIQLQLEVVLLQLAACIVALETGYAYSVCGDTLPKISHLLIWTDNTASKSWANRVTTSSRLAQPLLGILLGLLRRSTIGFDTGHIAGILNDGPDFISP
jgi:hypothetical protein